jgi:hypothetical protein
MRWLLLPDIAGLFSGSFWQLQQQLAGGRIRLLLHRFSRVHDYGSQMVRLFRDKPRAHGVVRDRGSFFEPPDQTRLVENVSNWREIGRPELQWTLPLMTDAVEKGLDASEEH